MKNKEVEEYFESVEEAVINYINSKENEKNDLRWAKSTLDDLSEDKVGVGKIINRMFDRNYTENKENKNFFNHLTCMNVFDDTYYFPSEANNSNALYGRISFIDTDRMVFRGVSINKEFELDLLNIVLTDFNLFKDDEADGR